MGGAWRTTTAVASARRPVYRPPDTRFRLGLMETRQEGGLRQGPPGHTLIPCVFAHGDGPVRRLGRACEHRLLDGRESEKPPEPEGPSDFSTPVDSGAPPCHTQVRSHHQPASWRFRIGEVGYTFVAKPVRPRRLESRAAHEAVHGRPACGHTPSSCVCEGAPASGEGTRGLPAVHPLASPGGSPGETMIGAVHREESSEREATELTRSGRLTTMGTGSPISSRSTARWAPSSGGATPVESTSSCSRAASPPIRSTAGCRRVTNALTGAEVTELRLSVPGR